MAFIKNTTLGLLIAALLTSSFVIAPRHASAQIPTTETNPVLVGETIFNTAQNAATLSQSLLEWAEKLLNETLKRQLLDYIVNEIIGYINGNDGDSVFVSNWDDFLNGVAGDAVAAFGAEVLNADLCGPFENDIKLMFSAPPVRTIEQRFECTLDDIVSNIDDFRENFGNGGWVAYQTTLQPNNNFWGVYLASQAQLTEEVENAKEAELSKAIAGGGFLGQQDPECIRRATTDAEKKRCPIVTPGRSIGFSVEKAIGAQVDSIVNADVDLASYVGAIADAMINRVLREGLALVNTGSGGGGGTTQAQRRQRLNNLAGQSGVDRFEKEKKDTLKDIKEALEHRESAQRNIDRAGDVYSVLNITHALDSLDYLHTEFQKVGRGDLVVAQEDHDKCQMTSRSYAFIQNKTLPRIERKIDQASEALALVVAAEDNDPLNNPDIPTSPGGIDNTDNADLIEVLKATEIAINGLVIGSTDANGNVLTLTDAQNALITIRGSLSTGFVSDARSFKQGIKDLGDTLDIIYEFVHDYERGLWRCTKHPPTTPMSGSTVPSNNWPWN